MSSEVDIKYRNHPLGKRGRQILIKLSKTPNKESKSYSLSQGSRSEVAENTEIMGDCRKRQQIEEHLSWDGSPLHTFLAREKEDWKIPTAFSPLYFLRLLL